MESKCKGVDATRPCRLPSCAQEGLSRRLGSLAVCARRPLCITCRRQSPGKTSWHTRTTAVYSIILCSFPLRPPPRSHGPPDPLLPHTLTQGRASVMSSTDGSSPTPPAQVRPVGSSSLPPSILSRRCLSVCDKCVRYSVTALACRADCVSEVSPRVV